ncbi:MAG: hypothetical protein ACRD4Q_00605 [Candidatus Acidiferrales bacterium]
MKRPECVAISAFEYPDDQLDACGAAQSLPPQVAVVSFAGNRTKRSLPRTGLRVGVALLESRRGFLR